MSASASAPEPAPGDISIEERIRRRAFELYLQRGGCCGSAMDDWLQAEAEILAKSEESRG
jgi:hypothetical protein